jgi:GMP synthase (glutamine-hydrolysing)
MKALVIQHVGTEGPGLIEDCLKEGAFPYEILRLGPGVVLPGMDGWSHLILMGGPMNVYEEGRFPFLRQEDLFIKEAIQRGKAVLGICLGAQLIAKALGAQIDKAPVKEIGWYCVSLTEEGFDDPLFSLFPRTFSVFQWHEDTFEIPRAGKLLATSAPVSHQAFRYGELVYGLQFHLEVKEEMVRDWLTDYESDYRTPGSSLPTAEEILRDTADNREGYLRQGKAFFHRFLSVFP